MENTALPTSTATPWRDPPAQPVDRSANYTIVTTVRMKKPLKARLDERCRKDDISLNALSVAALTAMCDHLDALDAAKLAARTASAGYETESR